MWVNKLAKGFDVNSGCLMDLSDRSVKSDHGFGLSYKEPSVFVIEQLSPVKEKKVSRPASSRKKRPLPKIYIPDNDSDIFSRTAKRGPYRKYSQATKEEAVKLSKILGDVNKASDVHGIPVKNLRRWIKLGTEKKKGGRKTRDPVMETKLKSWIIKFKEDYGIMPLKADIKNKALELTECKDIFKASKGWFEKFMARQFPELIDKTKKRLKKRGFDSDMKFEAGDANYVGKRRSSRLRGRAERVRSEPKPKKKTKVVKNVVEVGADMDA